MSHLRRLLAVCLLLGSVVSPSVAEPLADDEVPEALRSWVPWVLHDKAPRACSHLANGTQRRCVWAGPLTLELDADGGRFATRGRGRPSSAGAAAAGAAAGSGCESAGAGRFTRIAESPSLLCGARGAAAGHAAADELGAAAGFGASTFTDAIGSTGATGATGATGVTAGTGMEGGSSPANNVAAAPTCVSKGNANSEQARKRPPRCHRPSGPFESTVSISILLSICDGDRPQWRSAQRTPAEWGPASIAER